MNTKQYPFYLKSTVVMLGVVLFSFILITISEILIPLSFALMLAILLNPLSSKIEKWKIPKTFSIIISIVLAFIVLGAIGYFLISQVAGFSDELPVLKTKFNELLQQFETGIKNQFGISMEKQHQFLSEMQAKAKPLLGKTIGSVLGSVGMLVLIPVYIFLFMFYKTLILNFLYEVFDENNSKEVGVILSQTKGAIQSYMMGLLLEALVVAILNIIALLVLGVKYAVLLGVLGALLNVLPYIGGIIAIALPVIIATITKDGFQTQFGIIIAYLIIQFVDNHFLVPYLVSSKVKINALISIVIVLLGGALWGVSGMFLSIPFIGVLKIVFDRITELKPWGKLLGDEVPTRHKGQMWKFSKAKA